MLINNLEHLSQPSTKNKASRIRQWWRSTSRFTRIVITLMGLTTVFGIIFIGIPTAIKYCRSQSRYEIVSTDEEITQVIYIADEEKLDYSEIENKHGYPQYF